MNVFNSPWKLNTRERELLYYCEQKTIVEKTNGFYLGKAGPCINTTYLAIIGLTMKFIGSFDDLQLVIGEKRSHGHGLRPLSTVNIYLGAAADPVRARRATYRVWPLLRWARNRTACIILGVLL